VNRATGSIALSRMRFWNTPPACFCMLQPRRTRLRTHWRIRRNNSLRWIQYVASPLLNIERIVSVRSTLCATRPVALRQQVALPSRRGRHGTG
jgi:hypothetical protein